MGALLRPHHHASVIVFICVPLSAFNLHQNFDLCTAIAGAFPRCDLYRPLQLGQRALVPSEEACGEGSSQ